MSVVMLLRSLMTSSIITVGRLELQHVEPTGVEKKAFLEGK